MDKRINKKIETYLSKLKDDMKEQCMILLDVSNKLDEVQNFVQYIYDYDRLVLSKEDFQKRKRVKNFVPVFERCSAKRAYGEQCTRRKKEGSEYCGTHMKGTPNGCMDICDDLNPHVEKVEVHAQDIKGIIYYIDKNSNVYKAEDVITYKVNPKIIAKYTKNQDTYSIPELNI